MQLFIFSLNLLHSKVYELHTDSGITTYTGSANLTEGGLRNNNELICKTTSNEGQLEEFWVNLWENSILVDEEVINLFSDLPKVSQPPELEIFYTKLNKKMKPIFYRQSLEKEYPDLSDFYFNVEDYSIFDEQYWYSGLSTIKSRRMATQEKFYEINEVIESFAKKLDLYPHYLEANLTSGIVPSIYNFERVTGIWMRYGKHKSELKLFEGISNSKQKSAIEQFHKHACLQLAIGSDGLQMGMYHSTANDGVDNGYVADNWSKVKENIIKVYSKIQGHGFVWRFYNNKLIGYVAEFEIDNHTVDEFLTFYKKHYMDGYESFCMKFYHCDDVKIQTYKQIIKELQDTFIAILPLYTAMTYRIPKSQRLISK